MPTSGSSDTKLAVPPPMASPIKYSEFKAKFKCFKDKAKTEEEFLFDEKAQNQLGQRTQELIKELDDLDIELINQGK